MIAARRYLSEFVGTAFLLMGVVGSGIMAVRLADDPGLQLLQNAVATGAVLVIGFVYPPVSEVADRVVVSRDPS